MPQSSAGKVPSWASSPRFGPSSDSTTRSWADDTRIPGVVSPFGRRGPDLRDGRLRHTAHQHPRRRYTHVMSELPSNSVTLRFLAAPTDLGHSGSVDAGTVLEWVDKAAYAAAVGWAKSYCVTAYVGNIHFTDPVNIGDMVEVEATIVYTGRSSMHIRTVVSSGDPKGGEATMRSQCMVIFVAVGPDGKPIPVPQFEPATEEEVKQREHALARIEVRE